MSLLGFILLTLLPAKLSAQTLPEDNSKAVIISYHRIGEDAYPDTNLRLEQFLSQMQEIERGGYTVIPLSDALSAVKTYQPLPPKSLVINLEGAYSSAIQNAAPLLLEKRWPFTIFYSAANADQNLDSFANWAELKKLNTSKFITLAVLPYTLDHIAQGSEAQALTALNKARQHHREHFGTEAQYLSYPFGEYSQDLETLAKTRGFKAALTLDSGALHAKSDLFALPRFSMTESFGSLERFRLVANALPLPVSSLQPEDTFMDKADFAAGFTLPDGLNNEISCFLSGDPAAETQRIGQRIEIRGALKDDRARLNCTMEGGLDEDEQLQWRWFGKLYHRVITKNPEQDAPQ